MIKIKNLTWAQFNNYYLMPNQLVDLSQISFRQVQAVYSQNEELNTNDGWHEESFIKNKPARFQNSYLTGPAHWVGLTPPKDPAPLVGDLISIKPHDPCFTRREVKTVLVNDWLNLTNNLQETEAQHNLRIVVETEKGMAAWDPLGNRYRKIKVIDVPIVFASGRYFINDILWKEGLLYKNTPKQNKWFVWNATASSIQYLNKFDKKQWLASDSTCITTQEINGKIVAQEDWEKFNENICSNFARAKFLAQIPDRELDFAVL